MQKLLTTAIALLLVAGCTSIDVKPVAKSYNLTHVCIKENPKVIVQGFISVLETSFEKHLITTEVYRGNKTPDNCEVRLEYTALQNWDFATYMTYAELKLYRGSTRIGYGEYRLRAKGGFSLMKWASPESKLEPVIDEMLSEYK